MSTTIEAPYESFEPEMMLNPLLPVPRGQLHELSAGEHMATVMHGEPYIRTEETRWIPKRQWDEEAALPATNRTQRDYEHFMLGMRTALLYGGGAAIVVTLVWALLRGGW